jgi:hypothetical protein
MTDDGEMTEIHMYVGTLIHRQDKRQSWENNL